MDTGPPERQKLRSRCSRAPGGQGWADTGPRTFQVMKIKKGHGRAEAGGCSSAAHGEASRAQGQRAEGGHRVCTARPRTSLQPKGVDSPGMEAEPSPLRKPAEGAVVPQVDSGRGDTERFLLAQEEGVRSNGEANTWESV